MRKVSDVRYWSRVNSSKATAQADCRRTKADCRRTSETQVLYKKAENARILLSQVPSKAVLGRILPQVDILYLQVHGLSKKRWQQHLYISGSFLQQLFQAQNRASSTGKSPSSSTPYNQPISLFW